MLLIATAIGGFGSGCMFCLVALSGQFSPHSATPFVITMNDGENTGSVAAAIWSPLAPGGVHQPRWFQLDLPPSALHAWSGVKNSSLSVTSTKSRPSSLQDVFVRGPTSFAVPFWLHFIYYDGAALLWTTLGRKSLYLDVGRGSKGYHLRAIFWMDCLEKKNSPLRLRMIGCETWRNCLSLC